MLKNGTSSQNVKFITSLKTQNHQNQQNAKHENHKN